MGPSPRGFAVHVGRSHCPTFVALDDQVFNFLQKRFYVCCKNAKNAIRLSKKVKN
jgi:hypothetical protein